MGDIRVQRGRITMGAGVLSGTASILAVNTAKAFIRVNGLHGLPLGYVDVGGTGGGLTTLNEVGAWPTFLTASAVQIQRQASVTSGAAYYDFEVWEYTGAAGGPNEFIVEAFTSVVPPAGATTQLIGLAGPPYDASRLVSAQTHNIPIICGVMNDRSTSTIGMASWYCSAPGAFFGIVPTTTLVRQVGADITGNDMCRITYAVVSFRGSNWSTTHRQRVSLPAASGNAWYPGVFSTPLGNGGWANALPVYQWSNAGALTPIRDVCNMWYPGNGTSGAEADPTRFSAIRQRTSIASNHVIWAVTNPELETHFLRSSLGPNDGGTGGITTTLSGTGEARLGSGNAVDAFADILDPHEPIPSLPRVTEQTCGMTLSGAPGTNDFFRIHQVVSGGDVLRWRHDRRSGPLRDAGWGLALTSWPTAVSGDLTASGVITSHAALTLAAQGAQQAQATMGAYASLTMAARTALQAVATMSGAAQTIKTMAATLVAQVVLTAEATVQHACDWFEDAGAAAWQAAQTSASWVSGAATAAWVTAASGAAWATAATKSWFTEKDC